MRNRRKSKAKQVSKTACVVYGVYDSAGALRYVGQTRSDLLTRLNYHKRNAFTTAYSSFSMWLFDELTAGRDVSIEPIDKNATWDVSEILWIERMRRDGHPILNVTRGGVDTPADLKREGISVETYYKTKTRAAAQKRAQELGISVVQPFRAKA